MAKLKCTPHDRRVMVMPSGNILHRNDGSTCVTDKVTIGDKEFSIVEKAADRELLWEITSLGDSFDKGQISVNLYYQLVDSAIKMYLLERENKEND